MQYFQLSMLCILTAAPLHNIAAKPLAPHWDHLRVKHSWNNVPPNWESLGHPPAGTTIDLIIALMPYNENALIDALYDVSDPKSLKQGHLKTLQDLHTIYSLVPLLLCRYGSHFLKEQVNRLIAPHEDTLDLVHSWLGYHDIPSSSVSMTRGGSLLTLTGVPVSKANELLGASYQLYRHEGTNDTAILRTIGYSLPTVLHGHVQTVIPTTYFSTRNSWQTPLKHYANSTANMESRMAPIHNTNNNEVTPSSLRELYRMTSYVPAASDTNVLAIAGLLNQYPSLTDFAEFMARFRSDAVNPLEALYHVEVNGGDFDPNDPSPEANTIIQYMEALVYPTPILFYNIGGQVQIMPDTNEPARGDFFLEWLLFVLGQEKVPQTMTIPSIVFETDLPREYGTTICNMFAELGLRGASVLVASGNKGVGPEDSEDCVHSSGRIQFLVQFPSSCRGALLRGGFSSLFPRPSYQEAAVTTFLENLGDQYNGFYNPHGRGTPDISAQAINYYVIYKTQPLFAASTNCAASTAASIISLLNDYRISTGRTPLGFLNPRLYGYGRKGLYDVISGSNPGCGTDGFPAIAGWDPVTGLGTPDFLLLQFSLDYIPVNL
ncbi:subtilisin-like protein [Lactarius quietus]|nr:subtilisin-like protein [Lactarius quietus]